MYIVLKFEYFSKRLVVFRDAIYFRYVRVSESSSSSSSLFMYYASSFLSVLVVFVKGVDRSLLNPTHYERLGFWDLGFFRLVRIVCLPRPHNETKKRREKERERGKEEEDTQHNAY